MAKSSIEIPPLSPLMESLVQAAANGKALRKSEKLKKQQPTYVFVDAPKKGDEEDGEEEGAGELAKSIRNWIREDKKQVVRKGFDANPTDNSWLNGLYQVKRHLIPDPILKRIRVKDDLVASIINARSNHLSSFGHPRPDRFSLGYELKIRRSVEENLKDEKERQVLQDKMDRISKMLWSCGSTDGLTASEHLNLSQFLFMSTADAVLFGRIAVEVVYAENNRGEEVFHSFRPLDAGTIHKMAPYGDKAAASVRESAKHLIEMLKGKKYDKEEKLPDNYAWVQVVEGTPKQAFTEKECLVHNFYPSTNVDLGGYPITPLDTVIDAVMTHISITTHNKLYFQNGRAARGMLVVKSDDLDQNAIGQIRQQFNASINSVEKSWRMPVFGVGQDSDIAWMPLDQQGQRDQEFQFLSDSNARVILSAFAMSPDELPGYAHLSRGTNSQALSEGNNEFKLLAARDVGIKPLLKAWEDFFNNQLMPIIDPTIAKLCQLEFLGLDAETAEKESVRIQQDMPIHMTYDEVLDKVQKDPVGKEWGGEFPLNPAFQQLLDNHSGLTAGEIAAHFLNRPELKTRPDLQYVRDPMWFQYQEFLLSKQQYEDQKQMQQQQMQQQAQMEQQQAAQGQAPGGEEGGGEGEQAPQEQSDGGQELQRSLDMAIDLLSKSEKQLAPYQKRLIETQVKASEEFMSEWDKDVQKAMDEVLRAAGVKPKRGKKSRS